MCIIFTGIHLYSVCTWGGGRKRMPTSQLGGRCATFSGPSPSSGKSKLCHFSSCPPPSDYMNAPKLNFYLDYSWNKHGFLDIYI